MAALDIVTLDTATPQLEVPQSGDTYNAPRAVTINPVALTGSTATPALDIAQTWNTTGTPTALKVNVVSDVSNANSRLMDLQVAGASQFSVWKTGRLTVSAIDVSGIFGADGNWWSTNYLNIASAAALSFGSADLRLYRDAANTLAQRNGTNAQTFRLYRTYTAADNFQRLTITSASATLSALSGASVTSSALIPAGAVVVGVTARVSTLIEGASGFQIGTVADPDRWGDITGTAVGTTSDNANWTSGTIECFTAATNVVVTAKTSNFTAGAILVTIHYLAGQAD